MAKQFEYLRIFNDDYKNAQKMNKLGKMGWELVNMKDNGSGMMKRELEPEKDIGIER